MRRQSERVRGLDYIIYYRGQATTKAGGGGVLPPFQCIAASGFRCAERRPVPRCWSARLGGVISRARAGVSPKGVRPAALRSRTATLPHVRPLGAAPRRELSGGCGVPPSTRVPCWRSRRRRGGASRGRTDRRGCCLPLGGGGGGDPSVLDANYPPNELLAGGPFWGGGGGALEGGFREGQMGGGV